MKFTDKGIEFAPVCSSVVNNICLYSLKYRNTLLDITIKGRGDCVKHFRVNGKETKPFISNSDAGKLNIEIILE